MKRKNKIIIGLGLILIFVLAIAHTFFLSKGLAGYSYYLFREIGITLLSLGLCIYNITMAAKDKKNFIAYLVLANAFAIIATIHILKFFFEGSMAFGGILC